MSRRQRKRHRRMGKEKMTRHHLVPKSRGGNGSDSNLLRMKWYQHHTQWHMLFGNLSLDEIITCLQRIARMKHRLKVGTPDGTSQ